MFGMALSVAAIATLRYTYLDNIEMKTFSSMVSSVYVSLALAVAAYWIIWAFTPLSGGYHNPRISDALSKAGFSPLSEYVLWGSPMIVALICGVVAAFAWARGEIRLPQNADEPLDHVSAHFVKGELRLVLSFLAFSFGIMWIAATLMSQDIGLAKTVVRLGVALSISLAVFVYGTVGPERLRIAVSQNSAAQSSADLLRNDWVQGFTLMFIWPFLPLFFAIEFLHQQVRNLSRQEAEFAWLSREAHYVLGFLGSLHVASVLMKSVYGSIISAAVLISGGPYLIVGLVWLHETIGSWSFLGILMILFAVSLLLFLLPPVPGVPIYLLAGTMIVEKGADMHMGFGTACCIAVVFSFLCKMGGIVLQQQGIGVPLSTNVKVKVTIGVHTAPMKAIRHILGQKGLSMGKVAILVGGPDWPTSVLTGIMRLSLIEMLVGSIPVLFVVAPIAMTSALATQSHRIDDPVKSQFFVYLSMVCAMLASVVIACATALAGYYVQDVMDKHKREIEDGDWEKDPQEEEVLESVKLAEDAEKAFNKRTAWELLPISIRCLLLGGSLLGSAAIYLLLVPVGSERAFQRFTLNDHLSDLQGGLTGLINPLGWLCIYIESALCLVALVFEAWYRFSARASNAISESSPLLTQGSYKT
jgi:hypothetical protein